MSLGIVWKWGGNEGGNEVEERLIFIVYLYLCQIYYHVFALSVWQSFFLKCITATQGRQKETLEFSFNRWRGKQWYHVQNKKIKWGVEVRNKVSLLVPMLVL